MVTVRRQSSPDGDAERPAAPAGICRCPPSVLLDTARGAVTFDADDVTVTSRTIVVNPDPHNFGRE